MLNGVLVPMYSPSGRPGNTGVVFRTPPPPPPQPLKSKERQTKDVSEDSDERLTFRERNKPQMERAGASELEGDLQSIVYIGLSISFVKKQCVKNLKWLELLFRRHFSFS